MKFIFSLHMSAFTMILFGHSVDCVLLPFDKTANVFATTTSGRWYLPTHTSPTITHPRWSFWANGHSDHQFSVQGRDVLLEDLIQREEVYDFRHQEEVSNQLSLSNVDVLLVLQVLQSRVHFLEYISSHSITVGRLNRQLLSRAWTMILLFCVHFW